MEINRPNFEKLAAKYGRLSTKNLLNLWVREVVPGGNEFMEMRTHAHQTLKDSCRHEVDAKKLLRMIDGTREKMINDAPNP